jgi:uncharacterized protein
LVIDTTDISDIQIAIDQKYIFKDAFDDGRVLPNSINELIGFGAYAPMNKLRDLQGHEDIAMAVGFAKINSDIFMSLSTPLGTRFMNPGFGSKLYSLLFEPYDQILLDSIRMYTVEALVKDVHKIKLITVSTDDSQKEYNLLYVSISYQIINTPTVGNFTYPFVTSPESTKY